MNEALKVFYTELIESIIVIALAVVLRYIARKVVMNFAKKNHNLEQRANLVIKYIHILINSISVVAFIVIWGVDQKDILLTLSSITTVIGVAMFAQWSILSNITSGVILFFFFPFKIGNKIKIHDKDFPVTGEITNISAFHITLKSDEYEEMTYPNNLLLQKGISIINDNFEHQEFTD
jgi:small-conductance mechanosensitive channel